MTTTKDYASELVLYFANSITSEKFCIEVWLEYTDDRRETLALASREWDNAECDPEWATQQQDEVMDNIIEATRKELQ